MKYTDSITLDLARETVVAVYDSMDDLPSWQAELIELEPLDGIPGQEGSSMHLVYRIWRWEVTVRQTVRRRNLPYEFDQQFQSRDLDYRVSSRFIAVSEQQTRLEQDHEFICRGWWRLVRYLLPGAYRQHTRRTMARFKAFAEQKARAKF